MSIRFTILQHTELDNFKVQLLSLEQSIRYPIEGGQDYFTIVHGEQYHTFFSSMGPTRFLLVLDQDTVIGTAAATWKQITITQNEYTGLYISDLKLSTAYRKKSIPAKKASYIE